MKPVTIKQGCLALTGPIADLPDKDGHPTVANLECSSQRKYSAFPIAHGGGVSSGLMTSVYWGSELYLTRSNPLSLDVLEGMITFGDIDAAMLTPATCAQFAKSERALRLVRRLKYVAYAGGEFPFIYWNRV